MKTLSEIAISYNTDKGPSYHNFVEFYERYFEPVKFDVKKILEIGIGPEEGSSLLMWRDYFENAMVYGVDINNFKEQYDGRGNIKTFQIDQGNKEELINFVTEHGPFDIIIEDGSHMQHHQQLNLAWLYPYVKKGGFFVIEDLYFSYDCESELKRLNDTDTKALPMIENFISTGKIESDFITESESEYIQNETEYCNIENGIYFDWSSCFGKVGQVLDKNCECAVFKKL
jgi:hypothetical protein